MNVEQLKRLNLIKSLVEEQGADGDKRWLIAQLEAEAAEVERLMVLGVRYSDERIAAELDAARLRKRADRAEALVSEIDHHAGLEAENARHRRIAELEARVRELRVALESMVYQFGYDDGKGNFWCGGLSALEEAFEVLGWGMKHPIPKEMLCDEPDCKQRATCGTPTPSGYRSVCGEHYRAALAEVPKAGEGKP